MELGRYVGLQPTEWTGPAYARHGGDQIDARTPFAQLVAGYGYVVYLPGPALLACLVVGLLAAAGVGSARGSGTRSMCLVLVGTGLGFLVIPAVTAEFIWRYQLPALALFPAAAAIGWTALRRSQASGTETTASTDWPNGGRTQRSRVRVTGTTNRS